jgi:predicted RecB family endonuclease
MDADADVIAWINARTPAAPPSLRACMIDAISAVAASTNGAGVTTILGEAALHALRKAVERCDDRAAAIDLLAADALLTYMMEAAAEQGSDAIDAVAQAYGNARLAQLAANAGVA